MELIELFQAVGSQPRTGLPSAYQRVEYISGTGTQYIDSGIECTSDLAVDFAFSVSTSVGNALTGGVNTVSPAFRHHAAPASYGAYNYMYSLTYGSDTIPTSIAAPQLDTRYHVVIDPSTWTYLFEGDNYHEQGSITPIPLNLTTGRNYGILGRISQTGAIQSRPNQTYYFRFYRNGRLIGDFIPCYRKSDSEAGMYDLVTDRFFTNAGTGTIGVGPNV